MRETRWYDFLWVALIVSLILPFFDIRLVWLSLAFMIAPVAVTLIANSKTYCNNYCGRGQLYQVIGDKLKLTRNAKPPRFLRARWFRLLFFTLFIVKFGSMLITPPAEMAWQLQTAMLMTTAMGLATMLLFRPRSWCVCCPMGLLTQEICRLRNGSGNGKEA